MTLMREQWKKNPFIDVVGTSFPIPYQKCISDLERKMCLEAGTGSAGIVRIREIEDIPLAFQQHSVEGMIRYLQNILNQEEENYHKQVLIYKGKIQQRNQDTKTRYVLDVSQHSMIGIGYDSVGYPCDFGVYLLLLDISLQPELIQKIKRKQGNCLIIF